MYASVLDQSINLISNKVLLIPLQAASINNDQYADNTYTTIYKSHSAESQVLEAIIMTKQFRWDGHVA